MAGRKPELDANLAALDRADPRLAERLRWPVDGAHVAPAADGTALYKLGDRQFPLAVPAGPRPSTSLGANAGAAGDGPILVFGVGLGETVEALLREQPQRTILAWERDPYLLRLALSRHRWSWALGNGKLRLLLGVDLLDALPLAEGTQVVLHPLLARVYEEERHLVSHGAQGVSGQRAIVCSGSVGVFVEDLTLELRARGFAVLPLHLRRLSREELLRSLRAVRPALVAAVNYTVGLAELCEEAQVPLLCWEVDPELRTMTRVAGSTARAFVFTYRRRHIGEFRSAGFRYVEELPLAANPARRKPETLSEGELARYAAPVSYVGSSMVPEAGGFEARFVQSYCTWRGGAAQAQAEGRALLESLLAAQRADLSRDLIADELRRRCPGWPEAALAARFASEVASAQKRVTYVAALGRFGMQVWGDAGWKATEGTGVVYRGSAEHGQELNRIYCASRINVDIGRLYQQDIVTMRIFDILACGGFVLAERSDDLGSLFALDREIACYSTRDELVEKVGYYLAHEDEARAIARAGQAAVLARHTVGQRISLMLERLGLPG